MVADPLVGGHIPSQHGDGDKGPHSSSMHSKSDVMTHEHFIMEISNEKVGKPQQSLQHQMSLTELKFRVPCQ